MQASEVDVYHRANKQQAAAFFDVALTTLQNWIQRGAPVVSRGRVGQSWELNLREIAKWRYGGGKEEIVDNDPELMSPKERLDWYRGNKERDAYAKQRGDLIPADLLQQLLGAAFITLRTGLLSQHNTIASEYPELPNDTILGILRHNKELLAQLAECELPKTVIGALDELVGNTKSSTGPDSESVG